MEKTIITHLKPICPICKSPIISNDTCLIVNCCSELFHTVCLKTHNFYSSCCPNCEEKYYTVCSDEHYIFRRLTDRYDTDIIVPLFQSIYKEYGIATVIDINSHLISIMGNKWSHIYYPVDMFPSTHIVDEEIFKARLDEYTYGIFRYLCWDNIRLVGIVYHLSQQEPSLERAPYKFLISHQDYRIVRETVIYFLKYLQSRLTDDEPVGMALTIKNNVVSVFVEGLFCRIDIIIEYHNSHTLHHKGIFFDGNCRKTTLTCLDPNYYAKPVRPCNIYLKYNESVNDFSLRTGIACFDNPMKFADKMLKLFCLVISVPKTISSMTATLLESLKDSMVASLIEIRYIEVNNNTYSISIIEMNEQGELLTDEPKMMFTGYLSIKSVYNFVRKSYPYQRKYIGM